MKKKEKKNICELCYIEIDNFAGNPCHWGLEIPQMKDNKVSLKHYHIRCLNSLLDKREETVLNFEGEFNYYNDVNVTYKIDYHTMVQIINHLIDYYMKYGYVGEVLCQSDDAQIEAVHTLSDICDNVIKFKENTEDK